MTKRITSEDGPTRKEQLSWPSILIVYRNRTPTPTSNLVRERWILSVNLGAGLQTLHKETNDKLNACVAKVFAGEFAPDATSEARSEMKTILAERPDILEWVDALIFQNEQALARMYEFAMSEAGIELV